MTEERCTGIKAVGFCILCLPQKNALVRTLQKRAKDKDFCLTVGAGSEASQRSF